MKTNEAWEYCVDFFYDKRYVNSLENLLKEKQVSSILDCSCGTGFPSLELKKRGFDITCSDGDKEMLKIFEENMKKQEIEVPHYNIRWQELGEKFENKFDLVMCRGNSLPYANSWSKKGSTKLEDIEIAIKNFYDCVKPNGYLYVDITHENEFQSEGHFTIEFQEKIIRGKKVKMLWDITQDFENKKIIWTPEFYINGEKKTSYLTGYILTHKELIELLKKAGFENPERIDLEGEEHYNIYMAKKPF